VDQKRRLGGRARMDLLGHAVLLVEDDFCQARDTQQALQHAGAKVIGPFADSESALRSIAARDISCAILDIRLSDGIRFGIASALVEKGVPLMFITGLQPSVIPEELADVPIMQKPVDYRSLMSLAASISGKR
jgi:DNA-binding NtrC family response regulator